ncbi:MAG: hypothetical protein UT37_C0024G0001 [Parcubacteria group bacterium GW2011_GWA2_39_18]|nr:MAG: hypothetical protein UT37_C0024G0001 [Parcubacteria group bacterium GW2011_GWA2_39_18]
MTKIPKPKLYDLEERSYCFAKKCREFVEKLPKTIGNFEDGKQLVRASGSQAANYIEANEALSKKDFLHRVKICRKESKEASLWLRLVDVGDDINLKKERESLINEIVELKKIYSSIIFKSL